MEANNVRTDTTESGKPKIAIDDNTCRNRAAKARYGSFFLWGDVETVNGRLVAGRMEFGVPVLPMAGSRKVDHHLDGEVPDGTGKSSWFFGNTKDGTYGVRGWFGPHGATNVTRDENGYGIKQSGTPGERWFDEGVVRFSSRSAARREASARIAMIPRPLAEWIGRVYLP